MGWCRKVSLKQKISEQAKTMAQLNRSCEVLEKLRTCRNCLGACEFEDEDSFKGRFVREDVISGLLDKATAQIKQKTVNILNQVDLESGLTIIEKGNVKRFLSYYVDDVLTVLGEK